MSIAAILGYPNDSVEPTVHPSRMAEVSNILAQLATIDATLATALQDSMAVKVGDLTLDYNAHIAQLKAEGDRLLRTLSALTGLAIGYNKYTGASPGGSRLSVASYW